MAKDFMVKPDEVMKSLQVIKDKMQEFETLKKKLYDEAESLATQWKGATSESFRADLANYEKVIVDMQNALGSYCNGVSESMKTYSDIDSKLADEVKTAINKGGKA